MSREGGVFLVAVVLLAVPAWAQDYNKAEVFAGYSYLRGDLGSRHGDFVGGGIVSGAYNVNKYFGVVAEWSTHHDTVRGARVDSNLGLFGGRVYPYRSRYFNAFVQALVGFHRTRIGVPFTGRRGEENTGFAFAPGAGVDIDLHKHFAFRAVQVDYVLMDLDLPHVGVNQATDNVRVSSGFVFKWGE